MTDLQRLLMMRRAAEARGAALAALINFLRSAPENLVKTYAGELAGIVDLGAVLAKRGRDEPAPAVVDDTCDDCGAGEPDAAPADPQIAHPAGPAPMECSACGTETYPGAPCHACGATVSRLPFSQPAPKADDHRLDAAGYVPGVRQDEADLPTAKDKPLTDDEIAEALERDARGENHVTIAAALGRKAAGFNFTIAKLRRDAEAEAEDDAGETREPAPTTLADAPPEAPDGFWIFAPPLPPKSALADRQVHERLAGLGYEQPWTPDFDLKLARLIVSGEGVAGAAERLGLGREQILERWHKLLPVKGLDEQQRLLAALEYRATAWQAQALEAAQ